ncbi:hypothetical protein HY492_03885 [Candidatus Woesearchaeota archaeon]|nr:hypothetical protein [Candidatus Woesearchaeota archaeon]
MDPAWNIALIVLAAIALSFLKRGAFFLAILAGFALFSFGITVPDNVRVVVGSIALALVLFDSSRMRFAHLDTTAHQTLSVAAVSVGLHAIVLGGALRVVGFDWLPSITVGVALACIQQFSNEWLSHESRFTSLLGIVIVFLLATIRTVTSFADIVQLVSPWLVGLGTGIFVGILAVRVVKHANLHQRYVAFAITAVLAYLFSITLGGVGVFAVITLGLFLGNTVASEKERLDVQPFKAILVLACLLLGLMLVPSLETFLVGAILFALSVLVRFISWTRVPLQQRITLALHGARGSDVVAMLMLLGMTPALAPLIPYAVVFVLCSRLTMLKETF